VLSEKLRLHQRNQHNYNYDTVNDQPFWVMEIKPQVEHNPSQDQQREKRTV